MQEHQIGAGFLHHDLEVGHVGALCGQVVELVVMGGEHGAGFEIAGQMFAHGPGDGKAIEGGRTPADLIE